MKNTQTDKKPLSQLRPLTVEELQAVAGGYGPNDPRRRGGRRPK